MARGVCAKLGTNQGHLKKVLGMGHRKMSLRSF